MMNVYMNEQGTAGHISKRTSFHKREPDYKFGKQMKTEEMLDVPKLNM